MEIISAKFENLLTLGSAELELSGRGLLLVQGVNLDDSSTTSNGAGKSSIPDGLCWTIYGTTARGVTGDSVVNNSVKKDCMGVVVLQDGAARYRITRYRKHTTGKNAVHVHKWDGTNWLDLSKGTDKETQTVINTVMGCSLEVFQAAAYIGQEMMVDLPGLTDKSLKVLIEEAAGVEELAKAYEVARSEMNAAKSARDAKVAVAATLTARHATLLAEAESAQVNSKAFEDGRKTRAAAELTPVAGIKDQIAANLLKQGEYDELALRKESAEIAMRLDSHQTLTDELKRLSGVLAAHDRVLTGLTSDQMHAKETLRETMTALKAVDELVGTPCAECGKLYESHELDDVRALRQKGLDAAKVSAIAAVKAVHAHQIVVDAARAARDTYEATIPNVSSESARFREIGTLLSELTALANTHKRLDGEIERLRTAATVKLKETNPWERAIEANALSIKTTLEAISASEIDLIELEESFEVSSDAVKVFGPTGVRALILDTVTPFLNDCTSDYLAALSDGNIHAVWSTLTKTAKGETKEKFNIEVTNDSGADSFAGLSGGEKRKVRLSTAMALQDMVANRATKPLNIFAADEIDDSLDDAGLERLMGVLERKARERGTVLVISHNSLADWVDSVITVEKKGKVSTVSGANMIAS